MYTEKNVKIFLLCRMEAFAFPGVSYILGPQWENTIGDITSTKKKEKKNRVALLDKEHMRDAL